MPPFKADASPDALVTSPEGEAAFPIGGASPPSLGRGAGGGATCLAQPTAVNAAATKNATHTRRPWSESNTW
jgi:hypothetical protein